MAKETRPPYNQGAPAQELSLLPPRPRRCGLGTAALSFRRGPAAAALELFYDDDLVYCRDDCITTMIVYIAHIAMMSRP